MSPSHLQINPNSSESNPAFTASDMSISLATLACSALSGVPEVAAPEGLAFVPELLPDPDLLFPAPPDLGAELPLVGPPSVAFSSDLSRFPCFF